MITTAIYFSEEVMLDTLSAMLDAIDGMVYSKYFFYTQASMKGCTRAILIISYPPSTTVSIDKGLIIAKENSKYYLKTQCFAQTLKESFPSPPFDELRNRYHIDSKFMRMGMCAEDDERHFNYLEINKKIFDVTKRLTNN